MADKHVRIIGTDGQPVKPWLAQCIEEVTGEQVRTKDHTRVAVDRIPDCDVCAQQGESKTAYADARLNPGTSWAYVCKPHFDLYGCALGLGRGQRLVLRCN